MRGGHFCVLTGKWAFQTTTYTGQLTLHSHTTKLGLRSTSPNAITTEYLHEAGLWLAGAEYN